MLLHSDFSFDHYLLCNCHGVDIGGSHVPSSHSFDNSVHTRPDTLGLDSPIPEETAVEIADTSYAPVMSPDEPPEHPVGSEASPQDVNSQMNERRAPAVNGDTDTVSAAQCENNLLPSGKRMQQPASSGSKPSAMSRFKSVLVAVAAILVCTLIGAIVMFEFDGTSLHAVPGISHFHRKIYRPLRTAVGRSLPS